MKPSILVFLLSISLVSCNSDKSSSGGSGGSSSTSSVFQNTSAASGSSGSVVYGDEADQALTNLMNIFNSKSESSNATVGDTVVMISQTYNRVETNSSRVNNVLDFLGASIGYTNNQQQEIYTITQASGSNLQYNVGNGGYSNYYNTQSRTYSKDSDTNLQELFSALNQQADVYEVREVNIYYNQKNIKGHGIILRRSNGARRFYVVSSKLSFLENPVQMRDEQTGMFRFLNGAQVY